MSQMLEVCIYSKASNRSKVNCMYFGPFVGGSVSLDLDCFALRIELRPIIMGDRKPLYDR
jgi:hypothetical protein